MHKLNPRTAALLSAFGWAVGYLLAGKALVALLPAAPGGAARFFPGLPAGSAGGGRGVPGRGAAPGAAAGQGTGCSFAGGAVCLAARQRCRHGLCASVRAGSGVLADRTGHLWPGMLLHSANNLLVLAMG